jgi:hypothetical protein
MKRTITFQMERIFTFFLFLLYFSIVALSLLPCMLMDTKPQRYNRRIVVVEETPTHSNELEIFGKERIVAPVA